MKAVVFHKHGPIENLQVEKVPTPKPAPHEVLLCVKACGVNHVDKWIRMNKGKKLPMPHITGSEVAGEIVELGSAVSGLQVGQQVAVSCWLSCGTCEWCLKGEEGLCERGQILGMECQGGYAEYLSIPATHVLPLPPGMDCKDAAAVVLSTVTAWHMLVQQAHVQAGEDVLVLGANSGVGCGAIQIAKLHGARVITTARGPDHVLRAEQLGADFVVDISKDDFREATLAATNQRGVDVVVEHVGADTWQSSMGSLARNGRVVFCGDTTGREVTDDIHVIFRKQIRIIGSMGGTRREIAEVLKLTARGLIKPVIDRVFALVDGPKANRLMEERRHFGKMVVCP